MPPWKRGIKGGWPGQKEVSLVFDQDKEAGNTVVLVLKLYILVHI